MTVDFVQQFIMDAVACIRSMPDEEKDAAKVRAGMALFRAIERADPTLVADLEAVERITSAIMRRLNAEALKQWYAQGGVTLH